MLQLCVGEMVLGWSPRESLLWIILATPKIQHNEIKICTYFLLQYKNSMPKFNFGLLVSKI